MGGKQGWDLNRTCWYYLAHMRHTLKRSTKSKKTHTIWHSLVKWEISSFGRWAGTTLLINSVWFWSSPQPDKTQGNSLDNKGEESDSRYRISWLFIRPIDLFRESGEHVQARVNQLSSALPLYGPPPPPNCKRRQTFTQTAAGSDSLWVGITLIKCKAMNGLISISFVLGSVSDDPVDDTDIGVE